MRATHQARSPSTPKETPQPGRDSLRLVEGAVPKSRTGLARDQALANALANPPTHLQGFVTLPDALEGLFLDVAQQEILASRYAGKDFPIGIDESILEQMSQNCVR